MGIHDKRVQAILGENTVTKLLEAVRDDREITGQKMKDIAQRLGVGGRHRMRVEQRGDTDDAEMREVLSDWYNKDLHRMDKATVVNKLVEIFEDPTIDLVPLAQRLRVDPEEGPVSVAPSAGIDPSSD